MGGGQWRKKHLFLSVRLLLLPPGDLGTCWCMHQITVTWVSCLTSNLQSPLGAFLGCHLSAQCSRSPSPGELAAHPTLSWSTVLSFSQLCTSPKWGETPLPTVLRHKDTHSMSPMSIHHSSNSIVSTRLAMRLIRASHLLILCLTESHFSNFQLSLPAWWSQTLSVLVVTLIL